MAAGSTVHVDDGVRGYHLSSSAFPLSMPPLPSLKSFAHPTTLGNTSSSVNRPQSSTTQSLAKQPQMRIGGLPSDRFDAFMMAQLASRRLKIAERKFSGAASDGSAPSIPTAEGGVVVETPAGPVFMWLEVDVMGKLTEKSIPVKRVSGSHQEGGGESVASKRVGAAFLGSEGESFRCMKRLKTARF